MRKIEIQGIEMCCIALLMISILVVGIFKKCEKIKEEFRQECLEVLKNSKATKDEKNWAVKAYKSICNYQGLLTCRKIKDVEKQRGMIQKKK